MATGSPTRQHPPTSDRRPPGGLRLAPVRRQRRPALVLLGLLLVLAGGAVAGGLYLQAGGRVAVLAVARPVLAGHAIGEQDLVEVRISADPTLQAIPAADRGEVVGKVATVALLPGSLVPRQALSASRVPGVGQAMVGLALKPGQLPDALQAGDRVMLVATPPANGTGAAGATAPEEDAVLVGDARVYSVRPTEAGDATLVSLLVDRDAAPRVARAQAAGQASLVLVAASP